MRLPDTFLVIAKDFEGDVVYWARVEAQDRMTASIRVQCILDGHGWEWQVVEAYNLSAPTFTRK